MFGNLGIGEIIIIGAIALVFLGPERFPEFAKIAMRAFRDLRGYVDDIKREMAEELKPVKREMDNLARQDPEKYIDKLATAVGTALDDGPDEEKESDGKEEASSESVDSPSTSAVPEEPEPTPEPGAIVAAASEAPTQSETPAAETTASASPYEGSHGTDPGDPERVDG